MKYQGHTNTERQNIDARDAGRSNAVEYSATMRRAMSDSKYTLPEASLRLPFDEKLLARSKELALKLVNPRLAYILDIGIGGSNLGAKAIYEATAGTLDAHTPFAPKILFADTCAPELLADLTEIIVNEIRSKEELLIVIASKSGTTTETIVNASVLVPALEKKFGALADRIVCITDEGSPLWSTAEKERYHTLPIPKMVGGRYSVFSPAGIFPLLCVGIEGELLLRGAQAIVEDTVENGSNSNAFRAAENLLAWHERGAHVFDLLLFHPELESFGKWYRQLFAESVGKAKTKNGDAALHRMVPTVSIGSTDLHSAEQMHLAHADFFARILMRAHAPHWEHQFLASDSAFAPLASGAQGRAPCEVLDAIYRGVGDTYRARGVSFGEISLSDLDPESLGATMQFFMCTVMHLAHLLNINAFDQPDVESYKENTRQILLGGKK